MAKVVTRRELLDRWREIEEQDDDDTSFSDPLKRRRLHHLKEKWFADAFTLLIYLPDENHIWCSECDLMGPLLETFFNYFQENERNDSPLKLLWTRISRELRFCTKCIYQHHQGQEMYEKEYDPDLIGPLLDVLHTLDEERISQHLKEMNARIAKGQYDPMQDNCEVVCLMFEVLTYPVLLDDQLLASEFQAFIEAIDNSHELTLAGHQPYPGIYALLFLKSRRARSIGLRLAGHMGKLRESSDLDPLQPLLKKCIGFLEADIVPSTTEASRPRLQLDHITVWLGIKALLGFLEPPAFEEGILDRYPIFLSIVLNHISDDSLEFSHAVNCLRLLFEMLGCKLWLRATLSPSVMRNTLLGQCFHTRSEKIHKEIFDLFSLFLQSLEALQDGEHEKQRRHFLYFLLHQVTVSSNFSSLMRKKACQIALLIIYRGYTMNPPSPPFECAHMWGPSLVNSLKDSSLHSSLRQPAFDLIQTVVVSDASALVTSLLNFQLLQGSGSTMIADIDNEEEDEEVLLDHDIDNDDGSCWNYFRLQSRIASRVFKGWMCVPMLWSDVLVDIDPVILPLSFAKAVFWSLSRLSMVEVDSSTEVHLSVSSLKIWAPELSHLYGWKIPSGYHDGGDGAESKNSIIISKMCLPLLRTFKRLLTHYSVRMERGEIKKQWTWEPMISGSFILLLVDSNDTARQVCRQILEHVSATRDLTSGLQFLCGSLLSLSAILLGLRHALKLAQLDCILSNFQHLHHLFFVLCKLLKDGYSSSKSMLGHSPNAVELSKFSSQGGFLQQPELDSSMNNANEYSSVVSSDLWEKFCYILSELSWISIRKCLAEGKSLKDHKPSQMTSIRLLELLPFIFKRICRNTKAMVENVATLTWLRDLIYWGNSSLPTVVRYWKLAVASLLDQLKSSFGPEIAAKVKTIKNLISSENVAVGEILQEIEHLSISLVDEGSFAVKKTKSNMKLLVSSNLVQNDICSVEGRNPSLEEEKVQSLVSEEFFDKGDVTEVRTTIVLSDDEEEVPIHQNIQPLMGSKGTTSLDESKYVGPGMIEIFDLEKVEPSGYTADISCVDINNVTSAVHEEHSTQLCDRQRPVDHAKLISEDVDNLGRSKESSVKSSSLQHKPKLSSTEQTVTLQVLSNKTESSLRSDKKQVNKSETLRKDAHCDEEDDAWEFSFFKSANRNQTLASKVRGPIPKRQIIQLDLPANNRTGNLRFDGGVKRFKPPRLDDWYKPILCLDFFATVGLVSGSDEVTQKATKLKEVPVSFRSPMEYIEVFRPLVLEEFKAQLQSSFQEMTSPEDVSCGSLSVMSIERIDDFHIVRCVHEESNSNASGSLSENDLILLTKQPFQSSPQDVHIVGKIDKRDRDDKKKSSMLVVRIYLQNGCSRLNRARKSFVERSKWHVSRLMNITPQLREFQALSSIMEIPLITTILDPVKHTSGRHESRKDNLGRLSQPLQNVLKSAYNDSQLQAVGVAIGPFDWKTDFELSLIQGPPGTGKTRTIVAIVSSLLSFRQMSDHKRSTTGGSNSTNPPCTNSRPRISQSVAMARAWQDAALARQLNDEAGKCKESFTRSRVLICAQSNAAVDELVSRISSEGLYDSDGAVYKPYLVRVGNPKTIHPNSLPFFIDTLVDRRLEEEKKDACVSRTDPNGDSLQHIRATLEKLVDSIRFYEAKRSNLRDGVSDSGNLLDDEGVQEDDDKKFSDAELEAKLRVLYGKKKGLYKDLVTAQALERKAREESKSLRYKLRKSILKEAELVVTTLSGCGGDLYGVCSESFSSHKFSSSTESSLFDAVVIDEAAQALEPATLIPLQLLKSKGTRCVMVGDPKQLPATVLSTTASKCLFQCSMFERLQRAGHPVVMLTQQYRMHPEICHFPSMHFYENKLLNGEQMSSKVAAFHAIKYLGPYVFFDVNDGRELHGKNSGALSLYNDREADAAVEILKFFKKMYPSDFSRRKIGIITPYKCQLSQLRSRFSSAFGSSVTAEMDFNTVDGFQGREVDILILSTVRAAEETKINYSSIGFVADVRRMNVALTRAKLSLWILGNARTLRMNKNWAALLGDAHQRNLVFSISRPYGSIFNPALRDNNKISDRGKPVESKDVGNCVDPGKSVTDVRERRKDSFSDEAHYNNKSISSERELSTDTIKGKKRLRQECHNVSGKTHVSGGVVPREDSVISDVDSDRSRKQQIHRVKCHESKRTPDNIAGKNLEPYKKSKVERYTSSEASDNNRRSSNGRSQNLKTVATFTGKSDKETNGEECHKSIDEVKLPNDTISKRKHQREAVDALLSSALISSKKPESSLKSSAAKSNLPRIHTVRPPKPIKVSAAPSSQKMHNQINHPARKS